MYREAVERKPYTHCYVTDQCKNQEIYERAVKIHIYTFKFIPDWYKTQEMCERAVIIDTYAFKFIPNWYKTRVRMNERQKQIRILLNLKRPKTFIKVECN